MRLARRCRYEVERGTKVDFPQLVASYAAPGSSEAADNAGAAAQGAAAASGGLPGATSAGRGADPGALSILGEVFSKLIVVPSMDELGLGVEGEGGLAKAREDLQAREQEAAVAAATEKAGEAEATSVAAEAGEEVDDRLDMQATELGMDIS